MNFAPYSHSRLDEFRHCPHKFKLKYIDKVKVPFVTGLALYRGSYMHERIEHHYNEINFDTNEVFTQEEKDKCDIIIENFKNSEIGQYYYNKHGAHEEEFGLKVVYGKLQVCDYNDSDAWVRGKIDYSYFEGPKLTIVDWKSGKSKVGDTKYFTNDQMTMYAVWAFTKFPELQELDTAFVYIEHNNERKETFYRSNLKEYVKKLFLDTKACENGERYPKVVGPLCNFCDFKTYDHCSGEVDMESIMGLISVGLDF